MNFFQKVNIKKYLAVTIVILSISLLLFILKQGWGFFFRQPTPEDAIALSYHCPKKSIVSVLGNEKVAAGLVEIGDSKYELCSLIYSYGGWYVTKTGITCLIHTQATMDEAYMLSINKVKSYYLVSFAEGNNEKWNNVMNYFGSEFQEYKRKEQSEISDSLNSEFQEYNDERGRLVVLVLDHLPKNYELYINSETITVN